MDDFTSKPLVPGSDRRVLQRPEELHQLRLTEESGRDCFVTVEFWWGRARHFILSSLELSTKR